MQSFSFSQIIRVIFDMNWEVFRFLDAEFFNMISFIVHFIGCHYSSLNNFLAVNINFRQREIFGLKEQLGVDGIVENLFDVIAHFADISISIIKYLFVPTYFLPNALAIERFGEFVFALRVLLLEHLL